MMRVSEELERLGPEGELELEGRRVRLTNLDKVLWPEAGFTKREMIDYYLRVSPALLPHVAGHALTLGRFPDGVDGPGFAQTECRGRPTWMRAAALPLRRGEIRRYCLADGPASLAWIANQGAIELHAFAASVEQPERPTAVLFDLDPGPGAGLLDCCAVALRLRSELERQGLVSLPKTSGGFGLHVYVPLGRVHGWDETKAFARAVAGRLATEHPEQVTETARRSLRAGRVLIDWLQNDRTRTTAVAYSLRTMDVPRVSTPVGWEELEGAVRAGTARKLSFSPEDVLERLERLGDPFRPVLELAQGLP
jgi:bifunctional non-homologous end joining protein LigD